MRVFVVGAAFSRMFQLFYADFLVSESSRFLSAGVYWLP